MITIKCAKCRQKLYKYHKVGKGKVLHCWDAKIIKDYTLIEDAVVCCTCRNIIGNRVAKGVRMKQNAFTWSGTVANK